MVPRRGFEPLTCPLGGGRAIQLCHRGLSVKSIAWIDSDSCVSHSNLQAMELVMVWASASLEWSSLSTNRQN